MKLLFCRKCRDVINLKSDEKTCSCGKTRGKYLKDNSNAEYSGNHAIPFAIDNYSFFARIKADTAKEHNELYDKFYGENKIQCWLLTPGNTNSELIKKVEYKKPKVLKRNLGHC